jgi:hypothetical protein
LSTEADQYLVVANRRYYPSVSEPFDTFAEAQAELADQRHEDDPGGRYETKVYIVQIVSMRSYRSHH